MLTRITLHIDKTSKLGTILQPINFVAFDISQLNFNSRQKVKEHIVHFGATVYKNRSFGDRARRSRGVRTGRRVGERGSRDKTEGEQVHISGINCVSNRNKFPRLRPLVLLMGTAQKLTLQMARKNAVASKLYLTFSC
jgi:hypothetical protein